MRVALRRHVARDLCDDAGRVVDRRRPVEDDVALPGEAGPELGEHRLHGEREDVDALDDEHVVGPAEHTEAEARPAARTRLGEHLHEIVRPHSEERARLATDRRVDELRSHAVRELDRLGRLGVDELDEDEAGRPEVDTCPVLALAAVHPELAGSVEIHGRHAPGVVDPPAELRNLHPRLAREEALSQPDVARLYAFGRRHVEQPDRVGRRAPETRVFTNLADHLEQAGGLADAVRNGRGADGLERHVVGHAARVKVVVHALEHDVPRAAAARPQRPSAHLAVVLDVASREADPHRQARGAARRLDPHDSVERRALVHAQQRAVRL